MHVASLELCKELYELSEWGKTEWAYGKWTPEDKKPFMAEYNYGEFGHDAFRVAPAYDLDYLYGALITAGSFTVRYVSPTNPLSLDLKEWYGKCIAYTPEMKQKDYFVDGLPANALCKLAIELFKQEILERSSNDKS